MRAVVMHAYSATNSGDGLLVEEAVRLIRAALPSAAITVLALDPESFTIDGVDVVHPYTLAARTPSTGATLRLTASACLRGGQLPGRVQSLIDSSDLVVGVGGGYLRGKNPVEAIKMLLAHWPQLPRRTAPHAVYLSQSVGPLGWGTAPPVKRRLSNIGALCLRDDRSVAEVTKVANVLRLPDTALLGIASEDSADRTRGSAVALVARELVGGRHRVRRYEWAIEQLKVTTAATSLVQASARGNDDAAFYSKMGWPVSHDSLFAATHPTAKNRPGVVISVRLHGAIQSIRNGVPAIHLGYERKGWGAYEDLGLPEFVHNAFSFDVDAVNTQVQELITDPADYWERVSQAIPGLSNAANAVLHALRSRAKGGPQ